jgi:hypothetical protein
MKLQLIGPGLSTVARIAVLFLVLTLEKVNIVVYMT